jgi:non-specific protein-tyrosine kinase
MPSSLIALTDPRSRVTEAFRALRTNLLFSSLEKPLKTVLVTSPAPETEGGLGKSHTLANLAVTMAQGGRATILVDCDLRRPRHHELFGLSNDAGLASAILNNTDPVLLPTGVDNLTLLPSGPLPPNPADLLGSRRMEALIQQLQARADFVLFDAPPVLAVTDAALLASKLDGVLLVLHAGHTKRDHAERARALLEKIHIRVVGAVLTEAGVDSSVGNY